MFFFSCNVTGQKRWAIGLLGSVNKIIYDANRQNIEFTGENLYFGSSINLFIHHEFTKHWFYRAAFGYYNYSYQYYDNSFFYNNGQIVNTYQQNNYEDGFVENSFSIGYQFYLSNPAFRIYLSLGGSIDFPLFEHYLIYNQSSSNYFQPSTYSRSGFSHYGSTGINALSSFGLSYSISNNILLYGGINFRQGVGSADEFGSLGLQLGTMYYIGKPVESRKNKWK
jgi:hypothetical protein